MQDPQSSIMLSPEDLARDYKIPRRTQDYYRKNDHRGFSRLVHRVGRNILYRRAEVDAWFEEQRLKEASAECEAK